MTDPAALPVLVVADDLIWASRLVAAVQRAGATPVRIGSDQEVSLAIEVMSLEEPVADPEDEDPFARPVAAIVDLFGHRYDGVDAVKGLRQAGLPVLAVSQHDDLETRRMALEAGALRVFSYNKFFADGPALVERFLTAPLAEVDTLPADADEDA
ncbi:MAG: hypothetical protein KF809_08175 [Chloroflexi bacterium]|nr:hypothetical protein [Chloroflexota bacterium]